MCQEDEYREFKSFYDIRDEMILEMKRRYRAMKFDDKTISKFNLRTVIVDGKEWHYMPITEEKLGGYSKAFQGIRL